MPPAYSSTNEATLANVGVKLKGLRPVKKLARYRQQQTAGPASAAEGTTETPAWNGGAVGRLRTQSTTRPAFDIGSEPVQFFLRATLRWTYQVIRTAVYIISPIAEGFATLILVLCLIGAIFWVIFQILFPFAQSVMIDSIASTCSPICRLLGIALLPLPFCSQAKTAQKKSTPLEFGQVMMVQDKFNAVLEWGEDGWGMPLALKESQVPMRRLRYDVLYSTLPSR